VTDTISKTESKTAILDFELSHTVPGRPSGKRKFKKEVKYLEVKFLFYVQRK
jgi:hypothetical protein